MIVSRFFEQFLAAERLFAEMLADYTPEQLEEFRLTGCITVTEVEK